MNVYVSGGGLLIGAPLVRSKTRFGKEYNNPALHRAILQASSLYGDTILYKHDMISISGAVGGQMISITTQCTQVFSVIGGGRICIVSSYIDQDTDILVLVLNELVVFPLTEDWALWVAEMS